LPHIFIKKPNASNPQSWSEKFDAVTNINPNIFTSKPMDKLVAKNAVYKNPEYKSYHPNSYIDIHTQLDRYRQEQPVPDFKNCRGSVNQRKTVAPSCTNQPSGEKCK
jgi:hypothetical protein